MVIINSTARS